MFCLKWALWVKCNSCQFDFFFFKSVFFPTLYYKHPFWCLFRTGLVYSYFNCFSISHLSDVEQILQRDLSWANLFKFGWLLKAKDMLRVVPWLLEHTYCLEGKRHFFWISSQDIQEICHFYLKYLIIKQSSLVVSLYV